MTFQTSLNLNIFQHFSNIFRTDVSLIHLKNKRLYVYTFNKKKSLVQIVAFRNRISILFASVLVYSETIDS